MNSIRLAIDYFRNGALTWTQGAMAMRPYDEFHDTNRTSFRGLVTTTVTDPRTTHTCGMGGVCRVMGVESMTQLHLDTLGALDLAASEVGFEREPETPDLIGGIFLNLNDGVMDRETVLTVMERAADLLDERLQQRIEERHRRRKEQAA